MHNRKEIFIDLQVGLFELFLGSFKAFRHFFGFAYDVAALVCVLVAICEPEVGSFLSHKDILKALQHIADIL